MLLSTTAFWVARPLRDHQGPPLGLASAFHPKRSRQKTTHCGHQVGKSLCYDGSKRGDDVKRIHPFDLARGAPAGPGGLYLGLSRGMAQLLAIAFLLVGLGAAYLLRR